MDQKNPFALPSTHSFPPPPLLLLIPAFSETQRIFKTEIPSILPWYWRVVTAS